MIRIVTLEREFGCGGGGIACELARHLGWKLWDQQLTSAIAQRAQVAESAVALCDELIGLTKLARFLTSQNAGWQKTYEMIVLHVND